MTTEISVMYGSEKVKGFIHFEMVDGLMMWKLCVAQMNESTLTKLY